jgi:hypothetical protein
MRKQDRMVRLPIDLARRLDRLVVKFQESHVLGHLRLPNAFCERVPKHYVIEQALDEMERHWERSRRPRRPEARPPKPAVRARECIHEAPATHGQKGGGE